MSKKRYRPNYFELYPDTDISEEVLAFLKSSDSRMEYADSHRKRSRERKRKDGSVVSQPSLEDSYDRQLELNQQFPSRDPSPEQVIVEKLEMTDLRRCLRLLNDKERNLIKSLFFDGMTEREYAKEIRCTHQNVHKMKEYILAKLAKYLQY